MKQLLTGCFPLSINLSFLLHEIIVEIIIVLVRIQLSGEHEVHLIFLKFGLVPESCWISDDEVLSVQNADRDYVFLVIQRVKHLLEFRGQFCVLVKILGNATDL